MILKQLNGIMSAGSNAHIPAAHVIKYALHGICCRERGKGVSNEGGGGGGDVLNGYAEELLDADLGGGGGGG